MKGILALNLQLHENECYFIAPQIFETEIKFICAFLSSLEREKKKKDLDLVSLKAK